MKGIQMFITSLLAFVSTNIDDLFILTLFFGQEKLKYSTIVIGQYLGIAILVVISLIGSYIGNFIDQRYMGLLGFFPIYLAMKHFVALIRKKGIDKQADIRQMATHGVFTIAMITLANGADNVGVYVPLLTTLSGGGKIQMIIIFGFMTYIWCQLAAYLSTHPIIARQLSRYGHIIMPVVLLVLGLFILVESDSGSFIGL